MRGVRPFRPELFAILALALVAAACSDGSPAASPSNSTTTAKAATTTTSPSTALAQPPTSGPLQASASIPTGFASSDSVLLTEAPDGAVYFACVSDNCPGPSGSLRAIWVVYGDQAPREVEQVTGTVMSLAASGSELFVATNTSITAFDRSNGYMLSTTPDPPGVTASGNLFPSVSLAFGSGQLWALYGLSSDECGYEPSVLERIDPANQASPSTQVVSSDVGMAGLAVGDSGAFFGDFMKNTIEDVSPAGIVVAASSALPPYPNQVMLESELGGTLVSLDLAATSAIQSSVATYSSTTLIQVTSSPLARVTSGQGAAIESTLAGPLLIVGGCNGVSAVADGDADVSNRCQSVSAIERIALTDGSTIDPVAVPGAMALLGPYPVVITSATSGIGLVRLG
jgi:hypothetical protein